MKDYAKENKELKEELLELKLREAIRQSIEIEEKHNKLGYKLRKALIEWGLVKGE